MDGTQISENVLKGRFSLDLFQSQAVEFDRRQTAEMRSRGFSTSQLYANRTLIATKDGLSYTHLGVHRFIDMSSRVLGDGTRIKKVAHPIHNARLYSHAAFMVQELSFGYTAAMREHLAGVDLNM